MEKDELTREESITLACDKRVAGLKTEVNNLRRELDEMRTRCECLEASQKATPAPPKPDRTVGKSEAAKGPAPNPDVAAPKNIRSEATKTPEKRSET